MSIEEVVESAHRDAAALSPDELVLELQSRLGQKLVAFALGDRHPKTIGRYARGEREPSDEAVRRLVDLYTVVGILESGMRREAVRSWMLGSNPRLRGKAPIEVFHEGRHDAVTRAARTFVAPR